MWTTWVRERAVGALPPGEAPPRPPARLRVLLDLRLRRRSRSPRFVVVVASGVILGLKGRHGGTAPASATSSTASTSGRWSCSSSSWSSTSGASSSWPPGAAVAGCTWVTGAVTFLVAIGAAFTGYLSQQNFDSQWIATQAKDGINAFGVGAFFNVTQLRPDVHVPRMLLPVVVVALVAAHVLLVRRHGVCPPLPGKAGRRRRGARQPAPSEGARHEPRRPAPASPTRPPPARTRDPLRPGQGVRDRARRGHRARGAPRVLFSSPDVRPTTIQSWAQADPGTSSRPRSRSSTGPASRDLRPALHQRPRGRQNIIVPSRSTEAGSASRSRSTRRRPT